MFSKVMPEFELDRSKYISSLVATRTALGGIGKANRASKSFGGRTYSGGTFEYHLFSCLNLHSKVSESIIFVTIISIMYKFESQASYVGAFLASWLRLRHKYKKVGHPWIPLRMDPFRSFRSNER